MDFKNRFIDIMKNKDDNNLCVHDFTGFPEYVENDYDIIEFVEELSDYFEKQAIEILDGTRDPDNFSLTDAIATLIEEEERNSKVVSSYLIMFHRDTKTFCHFMRDLFDHFDPVIEEKLFSLYMNNEEREIPLAMELALVTTLPDYSLANQDHRNSFLDDDSRILNDFPDYKKN